MSLEKVEVKITEGLELNRYEITLSESVVSGNTVVNKVIQRYFEVGDQSLQRRLWLLGIEEKEIDFAIKTAKEIDANHISFGWNSEFCYADVVGTFQ